VHRVEFNYTDHSSQQPVVARAKFVLNSELLVVKGKSEFKTASNEELLFARKFSKTSMSVMKANVKLQNTVSNADLQPRYTYKQ
jgi:hypothetical protein